MFFDRVRYIDIGEPIELLADADVELHRPGARVQGAWGRNVSLCSRTHVLF